MAYFTIALDGLAFGMVLFIISIGLTVTLGLMRIVNLAHGAFAMTGGYVASGLVNLGVPFFAAVLLSAAIVGLLGAVAEIVLFRPLYKRGELAQALMTLGLTFVVIASLTTLFGATIRPLPLPTWLTGLVSIGYRTYPLYRLVLIGFGLLLFVLLWALVDGTLFGARLRAAVDNPRMSRAVGINTGLLFTITFAGGCALAATGAALGAEMLPLEPYYALRYLVLFLVVVGVGGAGSFKGSFAAAVLLGMVDTAGKYLFPQASAYLFYGTILALLLWRPQGLTSAKATPA